MLRSRKYFVIAIVGFLFAGSGPALAAETAEMTTEAFSSPPETQPPFTLPSDIGITPASATSCQPTLGSTGSAQCFTALSPGLLPTVRIISLQIDYTSAWNVCNETYQFKYQLKGSKTYTTTTKTDAGCSVGYASYKLTLNKDMVNGSQVCARQKNSATNQVYTGWYCHNVWG